MPNPLKICYRADFQQPQGTLNPTHLKMAGLITVELCLIRGPKWVACRPGSPDQLFPMTPQTTLDAMKACLPGPWFKKQLTDWVMYEIQEPSLQRVRVNRDDLIQEKNGRWYRKIGAAPAAKPTEKQEQQQL